MDRKILETERLILRRQTMDDAAFLLELMNEPGFIRFVADRGLRTSADAAVYLAEKILPSYERFGFGSYRVDLKVSAKPIGMCGLLKRDTLDDVDIGFAILERFSGQGYAFEAAATVMDYGRNVLGLSRIIGLAAAGNGASIHLLEKLGLKFQRMIHLPGCGTESLLFQIAAPGATEPAHITVGAARRLTPAGRSRVRGWTFRPCAREMGHGVCSKQGTPLYDPCLSLPRHHDLACVASLLPF